FNGAAAASYGVYYTSGATLLVDGCSFSGFTTSSIADETTGNTHLFVRNTTTLGGQSGIFVNTSTGTKTLDHVSMAGFSSYGVELAGAANIAINYSVITGGTNGVFI